MTELDMRQVECQSWYAREADSGDGMRSSSTLTWDITDGGYPRLEVYAHLGEAITEGDRVTSIWRWPQYSVGLMTRREQEVFDVMFNVEVEAFEHEVVFRGFDDGKMFNIQSRGGAALQYENCGRDFVVRFSGVNPKFGARIGFVVSYRGRPGWFRVLRR